MKRVAALLGGLAALALAVTPPITHLDGHLTSHMLQHLLIMTVAAPLLLLGALRRRISIHPVLCWLAGTLVVLVWHVPPIFAFGMRWHGLQHATFLLGGLLFWLPVMQPWPRWSRWSIPLYLFLATMPCDALSGFLVFCGHVVYPMGGMHAHHHAGISALDDQARAGALMWFWVTIAYLVPAVRVTMDLLSSPVANSWSPGGPAAGGSPSRSRLAGRLQKESNQ